MYNDALEKLKVVRLLSTISYDPTHENKKDDPAHIDFIAPPSGPHHNAFAVLVVTEMEIQEIPTESRPFESQWNTLQKALEHEYKMGLLESVVNCADNCKEKMMMLMEIVVPCILHTEN